MREQIQWQQQPYSHNQTCLDLIAAKPHGILRILDDQCSFPQVGRCMHAPVCFNQPLPPRDDKTQSAAQSSSGKSFEMFRRSCKLSRKEPQTLRGD